MDTSKFAEPRAFQIDSGWYVANWLEPTRSNPIRRIAQVLAPVFINLGRLTAYLTSVRRALAVRLETSAHAQMAAKRKVCGNSAAATRLVAFVMLASRKAPT